MTCYSKREFVSSLIKKCSRPSGISVSIVGG